MSVEWANQTYLDDDHAARQEAANLSELFRAHTSPVFGRLAAHHAGTRDLEEPPSVHTCEQLPTSEENHATECDCDHERTPAERASQATEALRVGLSRSRERQRKIIALIMAGEIAHALRFATCGRQSVQLECPPMAGGCGCEDNYVPVTCDSRLCPDCMDRRMGQAIGKYGPSVRDFGHPALLTLTIHNTADPGTGKEQVQDDFGRLRRRVIPPSGSVERSDGEGGTRTVDWVWKQSDDGGEPADYYWKSSLLAAGKHDLVRRLQRRYVDQGKGIPFDEVIPGGVYGIDIKQQETGRYHVHLHAVCEMPYVPQPALASVWEDVSEASVLDIRRRDDALAEAIGYVSKAPEFESVEDEVEYLIALKGARLIQPFGSLHGNVSDPKQLLQCSACGAAPQFWNYLGVVDESYDNMTIAVPEEGDRPPP